MAVAMEQREVSFAGAVPEEKKFLFLLPAENK
jgi:hypothetical protein